MHTDPLIPRGQSYATGFANHVGVEKEFEDLNWNSKVQTPRSSHPVKCRLVKNSSGIALLPGYTVTFKAGTKRTEVDGYLRLAGVIGPAVVDEFLPAAGVPNGNYFWVVTRGPALCVMPASQVGDIAEGAVLVGLTAAASTHSTTAGRVAGQDLTGATAVLGNQIQGALGLAMSAMSSSSTNSNILVFVNNRWDD